jgi:hypothetical protein
MTKSVTTSEINAVSFLVEFDASIQKVSVLVSAYADIIVERGLERNVPYDVDSWKCGRGDDSQFSLVTAIQVYLLRATESMEIAHLFPNAAMQIAFAHTVAKQWWTLSAHGRNSCGFQFNVFKAQDGVYS